MIQAKVLPTLLLLCSTAAFAGPFDAARGTWLGAVQFNARHAPDAHSVGRFALFIREDGSVDGEHANGCKLSGLIKPYIGSNSFSLDVNMKSCKFGEYNRRWQGNFNVRSDMKSGGFRLSATSVAPGTKVLQYDIEGTLTK